eukprot:Tbor_TRINITY_DN3569_c0_g1::TRINITY_DN3569_c0_g1_i1::g.2868::m.2868
MANDTRNNTEIDRHSCGNVGNNEVALETSSFYSTDEKREYHLLPQTNTSTMKSPKVIIFPTRKRRRNVVFINDTGIRDVQIFSSNTWDLPSEKNSILTSRDTNMNTVILPSPPTDQFHKLESDGDAEDDIEFDFTKERYIATLNVTPSTLNMLGIHSGFKSLNIPEVVASYKQEVNAIKRSLTEALDNDVIEKAFEEPGMRISCAGTGVRNFGIRSAANKHKDAIEEVPIKIYPRKHKHNNGKHGAYPISKGDTVETTGGYENILEQVGNKEACGSDTNDTHIEDMLISRVSQIFNEDIPSTYTDSSAILPTAMINGIKLSNNKLKANVDDYTTEVPCQQPVVTFNEMSKPITTESSVFTSSIFCSPIKSERKLSQTTSPVTTRPVFKGLNTHDIDAMLMELEISNDEDECKEGNNSCVASSIFRGQTSILKPILDSQDNKPMCSSFFRKRKYYSPQSAKSQETEVNLSQLKPFSRPLPRLKRRLISFMDFPHNHIDVNSSPIEKSFV